MRKQGPLTVLALAVMLLAWTAPSIAEEEAAAAPPAAPETPSIAPAPTPPPAAPKPKLMDINSATVEQLMTLPGISERMAMKVIAGRPYRSRVDLKTRNVLPTPTFNAIVARIVAKSPKLAAK